MVFDEEKKEYLAKLGKPDQSKKGSVDEAVWPVLNAINTCKDFYTTSSCAGRTNLFKEPEDGRKDKAEWLFVSHDHISFSELRPSLNELPQGTIWFKYEAAILHVVARDESAANKFLQIARESGFKHSGILSTTKRYVMEVLDSERFEVPIAIERKLIVDEAFVKFLVTKANNKLMVTRKRLLKLEKAMTQLQA